MTNTYSFPDDPLGYDGFGAPVWHELEEPCPECEDAGGTCRSCLAALRETDAGLDEADGRAGR